MQYVFQTKRFSFYSNPFFANPKYFFIVYLKSYNAGRVYLCSRIMLTGDPIHELSENFRFLDGYSEQHVDNQESSKDDEEEDEKNTSDNDEQKEKG